MVDIAWLIHACMSVVFYALWFGLFRAMCSVFVAWLDCVCACAYVDVFKSVNEHVHLCRAAPNLCTCAPQYVCLLFQIIARACEFRVWIYVGVCVCPWTWIGTYVWMPTHNLRHEPRALSWVQYWGSGAGVKGLTFYSLKNLRAVHTPHPSSPLPPPISEPSCSFTSFPPPIPCCLAPCARRPQRCTHALPHCVKLCLLVCVCVNERVLAWRWVLPCMCVCGSADKRSNHLSPFLRWQ